MVYFIKSRYDSNKILFESKTASNIKEALQEAVKSGANLSGAYLSGAYLRSAYLSDADLSCANLSGAYLSGADLSGANLRSAYLSDAYLSGADLSGANLSDANLRSAYLRSADLSGANLGDQWIIQGQVRSDGYAFFLQRLKQDKQPMIRAGCRHFSIVEAQKHWETTRAGQPLLEETRAIVRAMVDTMHIRGLK